MKGRALRRALETADVIRVNADLPLITDTTELITPAVAQEMLNNNKGNRPVNWKQVEEYSALMKRGEFALTAQGIVIDKNGNLLTGQTRLWAILLSDCSVYMRVSRGNLPETGRLLDRGRPQSARDLASRQTEGRHSPTEASIARGICAIRGNMKPSKDQLADTIVTSHSKITSVLKATQGTKKTKSVLMILAAICEINANEEEMVGRAVMTADLAEKLDILLLPHDSASCWGRGAAFGLALQHAANLVRKTK